MYEPPLYVLSGVYCRAWLKTNSGNALKTNSGKALKTNSRVCFECFTAVCFESKRFFLYDARPATQQTHNNNQKTSLQHDFGNIFGQKCFNFHMSECHLEHLVRPPECRPSDSECIWNILGKNISGPEKIISARNISHYDGGFPVFVLETGPIISR